ncbi:hypothetical protein MPSEU_000678400 [Mayamaea pseudoterrestris]|nr:hypothetical protein MPSEU_000678400 [Mayamaea pseudoterrestris]
MSAPPPKRTKRRHTVHFAANSVSEYHCCAVDTYLSKCEDRSKTTLGTQESWLSAQDYKAYWSESLNTIRHRLGRKGPLDDENMTIRGLETYESKSLHDEWTMDRMLHRVAVLRLDQKQKQQRRVMTHVSPSCSDKCHDGSSSRLQVVRNEQAQELANASLKLSRRAIHRARKLAMADELDVAKSAAEPIRSNRRSLSLRSLVFGFHCPLLHA